MRRFSGADIDGSQKQHPGGIFEGLSNVSLVMQMSRNPARKHLWTLFTSSTDEVAGDAEWHGPTVRKSSG
jgi:hypothetical protein